MKLSSILMRARPRRVTRNLIVISALAAAAALLAQPAAADTITIAGKPPSTISAGSAYSFTPTATDSAGHKVSFTITGKPSWATFNSATGALTGTPSSGSVGKYSNIGISAFYETSYSSVLWFSITVSSGSGTPSSAVTISGTPSTKVTAGSAYSFQPKASDPAGKTISYSVTNKPSWATFSIATGLLSGTPTTAQEGSYANITVSASDGTASSSLAPFTIQVTAPSSGTGSATLTWSDPTKNTNGTALTNLAGIRIYYGSSEASLNHEITVASTSETSYTVGGLAAGTWYFGATAYNTAGVESAMSALGSTTVQ